MLKFFHKWHNWIGIVLSIPTLIVGITAIMLTFQSSFKNMPNEPELNVRWLPGYSSSAIQKEWQKKMGEVRSSLMLTDSIQIIGTNAGLFIFNNGKIKPIEHFIGYEIRCLSKSNSKLFIGSNKGLFSGVFPVENPELILAKSIQSIDIVNDSTIFANDNKNLYHSKNGGLDWEDQNYIGKTIAKNIVYKNIEPTHKIKMHKLVIDLHTGKAFFGKSFEWIWILLVGLSVTLLTLTGIYMWIVKKRKKKRVSSKLKNLILNP
jgi:hypothetical protein